MKVSTTFNFKGLGNKIVLELKNKIADKIYDQTRVEKFEGFIKDIIKKHIENSDAWKSMKDFSNFNSLASHFGFKPEEVDGRLNAILDIWLSSIVVTIGQTRRTKKTTVKIKMQGIKETYSDVLSSDASYYFSKQHKIPWLKWLLYEKGEIKNYKMVSVKTKTASIMRDSGRIEEVSVKNVSISRSGLSFMVPMLQEYTIRNKQTNKLVNVKRRSKKGTNWKMPYPFNSGSKENNFLSRIFNSINFIKDIKQETQIFLGQLETNVSRPRIPFANPRRNK